MYPYWKKQTLENPLYPNLEWERPERKDLAGRLLIIGGSTGSFHGVADAYRVSLNAGLGEARALIPESLRKITVDFPNISYAPANSTGSFSLKARDNLLFSAQWADGVLLSGEYGRNSETSVVLSELIRSYNGFITITKDAIDLLHTEIKNILSKDKTIIVCSYSQLQKIGKEIKDKKAFKFSDDLTHVVSHLHEITSQYPSTLITKHDNYLILASRGEVTTTERKDLNELWCLETAAKTAANILQFKNKFNEALAASLLP
jgi:NAD(P)H-hydrate repair Nnr-like enzyme with NAD(P)H-hydrate dehydratase domain